MHPSITSLQIDASKKPRMVVISPGVDIATFSISKDEIYAKNNDKRKFVIGFIGRLAPEKNVGLFIQGAYEIIQKLKDASMTVSFVVIGDGELKHHLKDLVTILGIDEYVQFLGMVVLLDIKEYPIFLIT